MRKLKCVWTTDCCTRAYTISMNEKKSFLWIVARKYHNYSQWRMRMCFIWIEIEAHQQTFRVKRFHYRCYYCRLLQIILIHVVLFFSCERVSMCVCVLFLAIYFSRCVLLQGISTIYDWISENHLIFRRCSSMETLFMRNFIAFSFRISIRRDVFSV